MQSDLAKFWGWAKTNRLAPDDARFQWLSLEDHSCDVAAVFAALVRGPFSRGLARILGDDEALIAALTGLVGLHDLGKASWTFQGREHGPMALAEARRFEWRHHTDEACALLLDEWRSVLIELRACLLPLGDIEDAADRALMRAVFSHHGKPRSGTELVALRGFTDRFRPLPGHHHDPLDLVRSLVAAFPPRRGPSPLSALSDVGARRAALHWLMGMVNLADWIGSNGAWFPLRPQRKETFDRAAAVAAALDATGLVWLGADAAETEEAAIARTLALYTDGHATALRPVQRRIVEAVTARPPEPGDVLVLEEETGGGKTLAAYLAHALLARRGLVDGLTFCLPTRAAAKAIHDGAVRVYGARFPPVLALPGYDEAGVSPLPHDQASDDTERGLPWAARSRHRFLVAPVAVGTVDQLLLGTLTVPYAHLRSCAVARNLLVVDEVHSSDPYMRELLREAVLRQRRLGGITLLMSATLGADLRARLFTPGTAGGAARGRRGPVVEWSAPVEPAAAMAAPYPVLWRRGDDPVWLGEAEARQKRVRVEPSADWALDPVAAVAARAIAAAAAGARVLVIRNTVRLARATATAIRERAPGLLLHLGQHPVCHHARYARPDRIRLDDALRAALHPDLAPRNERGVVAVTTQTAEQSLDIDADLLITDLVPADVLLQRIGRLHRNRSAAAEAARPVAWRVPVCVVLAPERAEDLLAFARAEGPRPNNWGTDRAYANVLSLVATRRLIGAGAIWTVPINNRQLVETAVGDAALHALVGELGERGEDALRRVRGKQFLDRELAGRAHFGFEDDPALDALRDRFDTRGGGEAVTRLGLQDVRLTLAKPFRSPFGERIEVITVPGYIALARQIRLDRDAPGTWRESGPDEVTITVEGHGARFVYDTFGLDLVLGDARQ